VTGMEVFPAPDRTEINQVNTKVKLRHDRKPLCLGNRLATKYCLIDGFVHSAIVSSWETSILEWHSAEQSVSQVARPVASPLGSLGRNTFRR
jgi:hypothetical protein